MKTQTSSLETATPESAIRILKIASCLSVTGKSTLTYQIGCTSDSQIQFRIFGNSAAGAFNQDWVPLSAIRQAITMAPSEKEITSFILFPLYQGKSVNTPSFLLAALKNEGLLQPSTTKRRCHEWVDETRFVAEMRAWSASGKEAKVEDSPKPAKGRGMSVKGADQLQPTEIKPDEPPKVEAISTALPGAINASKRPKVVAKGKGK